MTLAPGARLGPFEIVAPIGAGGMGEVYRARDTKLKRDVALKVLPDSFASDPDRLARFTREAQTLASLNHPNIAHIHGLEESGGVTAIVMEVVEGEDLSQRIARGAIPLDEALPIAKQIAEALEAAHEHGIIHRDLKPANIKIRPDGTVKVLDFGLAKALDANASGATAGSAEAMNSPTMTSPAMTAMGLILGTAAYMAPEQASGRAVDKRADIWSFGVVLWEMLSGRRLFDGETVSHTLADVLRAPVDVGQLPADTPGALRDLLRRCLTRDVRKRLRDIGDARIRIDEVLSGASENTARPADASTITPAPSRTRERVVWGAAVVVLGSVAAGAIAWALRPTPPPTVTRLAATLPLDYHVAFLLNHALALSPDGSQIAFVAVRTGGKPQIYLRALDSNESRALPGTENAEDLFFSPDGKWLGFGANRMLMKVAVGGGVPVPICPALVLRGASWGDNGTIVFAPFYGSGGLSQVPENGGTPTLIVKKTPADGDETAATGENADRWPELLPGGQAVLFTAWRRNNDESQVMVERLDTHKRLEIIRGGTSARYLPTGHIVYARGAVLWAVPFDLSRLTKTGDPVQVAEGVMLTTDGAAQFDISRTGSLVYIPGKAEGVAKKLVWLDRDRKDGPVPLGAPFRNYGDPRLSPNEQQVAVTIGTEKGNDIFVWDIPNGRLSPPLTSDGMSGAPHFAQRGERIVFRSRRPGVFNLFSTLANGGGDERQLTPSGGWVPVAVSRDDQIVFLMKAGGPFSIIPMTGDRTPRVFFQANAKTGGAGGSFSSDGRWMAYVSDETGSLEVYVRSFPDGRDRRQISTDGGWSPRFARSGPNEELYYQKRDQIMAVGLTTQPTLNPGQTRVLFEGSYGLGFDVTRDGRRFLMTSEVEGQKVTRVNVVLNWFEELRAKLPGIAAK